MGRRWQRLLFNLALVLPTTTFASVKNEERDVNTLERAAGDFSDLLLRHGAPGAPQSSNIERSQSTSLLQGE